MRSSRILPANWRLSTALTLAALQTQTLALRAQTVCAADVPLREERLPTGGPLARMRNHDMLFLAGEQLQVATERAKLRHPESCSSAFLMKMRWATARSIITPWLRNRGLLLYSRKPCFSRPKQSGPDPDLERGQVKALFFDHFFCSRDVFVLLDGAVNGLLPVNVAVEDCPIQPVLGDDEFAVDALLVVCCD